MGYFIIIILLPLFHVSFNVVDSTITLPDGRVLHMSEQEDYVYFLEKESPDIVERLYILLETRSNTAFLCPQGYSIIEMQQELVVNPNISSLHPEARKPHKASLHDNYIRTSVFTPCPTLYHCLGYQACLFKFGNEFCGRDPAPSLRKVILLTIACYRDDLIPILPGLESRKDFVLHMYYKSQLDLDSTAVKNYSATEVRQAKSSEFQVFGASCPTTGSASRQRYSGNCSELILSRKTIIQRTWTLLGRVHSEKCRNEIMQIYCAFQYNTQGLCVPPFFINQDKNKKRNFNFRSLPAPNRHPTIKRYKQFLSEHHENLIPARLAFLLLIHKDVPAVVELLHAIYRSEHFYVIHVDSRTDITRKELNDAIVESFSSVENIVVLPLERSFPTSWASYEIVRAELEGFEELLRMGVWDFAINLSGSDLPLRDIDDLSLALAPHRGLCFLPFVQLENDGRNVTSDNLDKAAFYACDGYVYNVTATVGFPAKDEIEIYRSPQWGVFSRDFVEHLTDEKLRSPIINTYQFYLQTHVVPDESYIPTVLMNSPFRDSLRLASIHTVKEFQGRNTDDLCRHLLSDSDFCGQGPGFFEDEDIPTLLSHSHRSFFSRKFRTDKTNSIRKFVLELSQMGYYQFFETFLPSPVLKVLAEAAIIQYGSQIGTSVGNKFLLETVKRLYVTPSLVPHDSCCRSKVITGLRKIMDYNYWMDISFLDTINRSSISARLLLEPTVNGRFCYSDGDLKMIFISPWMKDETSIMAIQSYGLDQTLPLPYGPAFSNGVSVVLLLSHDTENKNCRGKFYGNPLIFVDTFKPININLQLISPGGNAKCRQRESVFFQNPPSDNETSPSDDEESNNDMEPLTSVHHFVMRCEKMEPGPWRLQMTKIGSLQERVYNIPFYLLDYSDINNLNSQLQDVQHLWKIKGFEVLSDETLNFEDESSIENLDIEDEENEDLTTSSEENLNNCKLSLLNVSCGAVQKWFFCSGGIVTCSSIIILIYLMLIVRKMQIQQRHIFSYIMTLGLTTVFQILIFMFYC